jgi:hypothetical protein
MRQSVLFHALILPFGCTRPSNKATEITVVPLKSGLVATCSPNPCDQHTHPSGQKGPHPFMWIYKTEVRNTLDVPLRIFRFEAYVQKDGRWQAGNVMGRSLTAKDFDDWYGDGPKITGGEIPPGSYALDAANWHGSDQPTHELTKWAYWAVDPSGKEHYAEVIVESVPIQKASLPESVGELRLGEGSEAVI